MEALVYGEAGFLSKEYVLVAVVEVSFDANKDEFSSSNEFDLKGKSSDDETFSELYIVGT